ncbi:MAG TPA: asparaginase [Candidatus Polarisedimenticolia bacterium]|nr:asparaginase [Candidatus Polarisedimenticolia bacterium]
MHGYAPLVEVWRGDTVESVHYGAIALVDAQGHLVASIGAPDEVTFLRSAAKPAQILPLLASGVGDRFGFTDAEIAVMIGSHGGEPFHVDAVQSILGKIGLDETALQCGAHAPYHRPSARALRAAGASPTALHNNCSGKHAGMLALSVALGAPVATYVDPVHPVQVRIRAAVESLAGLGAGGARLAVDGCSAPTFAVPLRAAALLFARLVAPEGVGPEIAGAAQRAVAAMRRHPEMIAGTDRLCTALMREGGAGLIAKIGAEGIYGLGFARDGRGFGLALKIADGEGQRSRHTAAIEALRQVGVLSQAAAASLAARFVPEIRNHRGLLVGRVGTVFELETSLGGSRG